MRSSSRLLLMNVCLLLTWQHLIDWLQCYLWLLIFDNIMTSYRQSWFPKKLGCCLRITQMQSFAHELCWLRVVLAKLSQAHVVRSFHSIMGFNKVVNLTPSFPVKSFRGCPFHSQSWYYHLVPINLFPHSTSFCVFSRPVPTYLKHIAYIQLRKGSYLQKKQWSWWDKSLNTSSLYCFQLSNCKKRISRLPLLSQLFCNQGCIII